MPKKLLEREEPLPDMALEGKAINPDKVGRTKDVEKYIQELRNGIISFSGFCKDPNQFSGRMTQIYNSLYELVFDKAPALLTNNVHGKYIRYCLEDIKYDISLGARTIKYSVFYLVSVYNDLVTYLRNPTSGLTIDESHQFIEENKKRAQKAKSKKHNDVAQAHVDSIEEDTSGGSSGI